MMRRRELMGMQGVLKTVSGPIVTVNDALARNAKSLVVNFSPVQAAGTPSPDNVLPISGWTGVTGYRDGVNLFNYADDTGWMSGLLTDDGSITPNANWMVSDYIRVFGKTVTLSNAGGVSSAICLYDGNKGLLIGKKYGTSGATDLANITITSQVDATYCRFSIFIGQLQYKKMYQLELGATPTPYAPYTGATYPVDWTDTAGTVYGGYVDLVSEVLVATWVKKKISDFTWSYSTYNSANAFRTDPLDILGNSPEQGVMCSAFASESMVANYAGSANKPNHTVYRLYTTQERRIFVKCTEYTGVSDFLAAYGNEEIAYKLDTPISYQLTPQTVAMLRGTNNVWSNANGNVELAYYAQ